MIWTELQEPGIYNEELEELQILHSRIGVGVSEGVIGIVEDKQEKHLALVHDNSDQLKRLNDLLSAGTSEDYGLEIPSNSILEIERWFGEYGRSDIETEEATSTLRNRVASLGSKLARDRVRNIGRFIVEQDGGLLVVIHANDDDVEQNLHEGYHMNVARMRGIQLTRADGKISAAAVVERTISGLAVVGKQLGSKSVLETVEIS